MEYYFLEVIELEYVKSFTEGLFKCPNCNKTVEIIETSYPEPDGYDHDCGCPYCGQKFYTISKKSLDDYCAYVYPRGSAKAKF